jgi:hypothetical protein
MLEKKTLFNNWCWENKIYTCRRINLHYYLSPCIKLIQNGSEINIRSKTLKLLEKNIGKTLEGTGLGNIFLNTTAIAQEIRARIEK